MFTATVTNDVTDAKQSSAPSINAGEGTESSNGMNTYLWKRDAGVELSRSLRETESIAAWCDNKSERVRHTIQHTIIQSLLLSTPLALHVLPERRRRHLRVIKRCLCVIRMHKQKYSPEETSRGGQRTGDEQQEKWHRDPLAEHIRRRFQN